jgi:hypothetical protein
MQRVLKAGSKILILVLVLSWSGSALAGLVYTPVEFRPFYNDRISNRPGGFPEGMGLILGGIPFNIPPGENNTWWSGAGQTNWVEMSITIPVNIYGVTEVHPLINTGWGLTGGPYTWMEFFGSSGAYYRKDLYGDVDIRGWQYDSTVWTTNNIQLPTVEVWGNGSQHLDKQHITLPPAFRYQTLVSIKMTDAGAIAGGYASHRAYLQGLTVGANRPPVFSPISLLLMD